MHEFLKSIGFRQIKTKKQEEILIGSIIKNPQSKKLITNPSDDEMMYAEFVTNFAPNIGIKVCGQVDENDEFHFENYYPYFEGRYESTDEDSYIGRKMNLSEYSGMCDDIRMGVSLIFHLSNPIDYLNNMERNNKKNNKYLKLSGLCSDGVILLPTIYSEMAASDNEYDKLHVGIVSEAKNGDKDAIEKLTMEEIDIFTQNVKRVKQEEDILSIVETSLIPFGMEAELYKILGIILKVDSYVNNILGETIYVLKVICNQVIFDLCINKEDLQGEPTVGRRFRGICWLQGAIFYTE